ncbi:MAG: hypothetical protein EOO42_01270 [Flavobacteriales bacterium]|nr:MAG: hypothetical protein EOO42_01270 [Flavobacteriales bacterium]
MVINLRPHILKWTTPQGEAQQVPCRYYPGGGKEGRKTFLLDDGTNVLQLGQVRLDVNSPMPGIGQEIIVEGVFEGIVRGTFEGQLTFRIDV